MQEQREMEGAAKAPISVIIVAYCSADVIEACLDSLIATTGATLRVVVCDNASPDDSAALVADWAGRCGVSFAEAEAGAQAPTEGDLSWLTLLRVPQNMGFAGGVNTGLTWFLSRAEIELFWILNPDSVVEPGTAAAYVRRAEVAGPFALMGGRTRYLEPPGYLQSDGGRIRRWTGGVCYNVNQGLLPAAAEPPLAGSLDFISGANMVASRTFVEMVGPLREDYFLYYEEVDWAYRRGVLPLLTCPEAVVHHHGGTAIGSGSINRRGSAFANYFNFRNRLRFVARFAWPMLPVTYAFSIMQIAKIALMGGGRQAVGALRGLHQLAPPREVSDRIASEAAELAFGRWGRRK
ncbi:MAG: rhamnosyl transferase related protein [Roseovarius sp. BRH_c41]|uniref:glycosyltransferase family 2 protein n=1 Tax=Roseovarius sp. BRH_c41 TaxID=1629709 RepID=UPI0005F12DB3|nr:glycosyltransferase family 2 protein [Roseovarius sp. BRH_c41]KJS44662.1 MAG: rhamnosyl transferase related protein [Roseovarius sp. BRH_c41]